MSRIRHEPTWDPTPDPALRDALHQAVEEPPVADVDWDRMRDAVARAAASRLERRRSTGNWRERARRWRSLPLAMAAAAAMAVLLVRGPGADAPDTAVDPSAAASAQREAVAELLLIDVSDQEFQSMVTGRSDAASLLWFAVSGD